MNYTSKLRYALSLALLGISLIASAVDVKIEEIEDSRSPDKKFSFFSDSRSPELERTSCDFYLGTIASKAPAFRLPSHAGRFSIDKVVWKSDSSSLLLFCTSGTKIPEVDIVVSRNGKWSLTSLRMEDVSRLAAKAIKTDVDQLIDVFPFDAAWTKQDGLKILYQFRRSKSDNEISEGEYFGVKVTDPNGNPQTEFEKIYSADELGEDPEYLNGNWRKKAE